LTGGAPPFASEAGKAETGFHVGGLQEFITKGVYFVGGAIQKIGETRGGVVTGLFEGGNRSGDGTMDFVRGGIVKGQITGLTGARVDTGEGACAEARGFACDVI